MVKVGERWLLLVLLVAGARAEDDYDDYGEDEFDPDMYGGMDPYGGGMDGYGGYGDDEYGGGGGGSPGPAYEILETADDVTEYLSQEETEASVLGYFDEERDADAIQVFQDCADENRYDFRFGYTTDEEVRTNAKYLKSPVVIIYLPPRFVSEKYGDKVKARFPNAKITSADSLGKFLTKKSLPLVGQKTWKSNQRYEKLGKPILTLYAAIDLEKNAKGFEYFANRLRKVAVDYKDKLLFNIGDKEDFSYILDDYDFDNKLEGKKAIGVGIKDDDKYYKMDTTFNVDNLRSFVSDYFAGSLTPKIKETPDYDAEADPEDDDAPPGADMYEGSNVVSLTTDSFDSVIDGKDAFLEFYAPWCGHCQSLKPTYKKLAAKLADTDGIVVAAMEATEHTPPPQYEVAGYPTIYFKPKDGKPIPYDDDRDLSSMIAFAKKHGSSPALGEL